MENEDGVYFLITFSKNAAEGPEGSLLKFTTEGKLEWSFQLKNGEIYGKGVILGDFDFTSDGNIIIAGGTYGTLTFDDNINSEESLRGYLVVITPEGNFTHLFQDTISKSSPKKILCVQTSCHTLWSNDKDC